MNIISKYFKNQKQKKKNIFIFNFKKCVNRCIYTKEIDGVQIIWIDMIKLHKYVDNLYGDEK